MSKEWSLVKKTIMLNVDEKYVYMWWGVGYEGTQRVMVEDHQLLKGIVARKTREKEAKHFKYGNLVLTNQRIFWLEKHGTLKKSLHLKYFIPIQDIVGVYSSGKVFKNLYISDGNKEYKFIRFTKKNIEDAVQRIKKQVSNTNKTNLPPPPPPLPTRLCPICNQSLSFIQEYERWYCYNCKQYR